MSALRYDRPKCFTGDHTVLPAIKHLSSRMTTLTWMVWGQYPGVSFAQPSVLRAWRAYVVADGINNVGFDSVVLYCVMRVATYIGHRHWKTTSVDRYSYSRPRMKYFRYCYIHSHISITLHSYMLCNSTCTVCLKNVHNSNFWMSQSKINPLQ